MSISLLRLQYVRAKEVFGTEYELSDGDDGTAFEAKITFRIENALDSLDPDDDFLVNITIEAKKDKLADNFFKMTIQGVYRIVSTDGLSDWLSTAEAKHVLGAALFPYLRNLAKPLLEHLGASDIAFPWHPPITLSPAKKTKRTTKSTKNKTS